MRTLTMGNIELFKRTADERFPSLSALAEHCAAKKAASQDRWIPPKELFTFPVATDRLVLSTSETDRYQMNDWSFSQLCRLACVSRDTVNRLTSDTASLVFRETIPRTSTKPIQLYTEGQQLRSIHGTSYTRVHDADLVDILQECAVDFEPPQKGMNGATGLYCGEQDMFCFMIDPTGWTEIDGEAFAPGFFLWNSEVGRRSLGVQTFWFQAVCQNHIVWDAVEVADFSRKHTANVHESLGEIRRIIQGLVAKRDERKDAFARVMAKAMKEKLGDDADEAMKALLQHGISRGVARQALDIAVRQGRFTIFSLVDALTRLSSELVYAGDRMEADAKASSLLALAV